jgi:hypothetical protein
MRVIVTGSRDADERQVKEILDRLGEEGEFGVDRKGMVLVQGGCPTGADYAAFKWALNNGIPVQTFKADWDKHGKAAGPIRNREMAKSGADIALAFPLRQGESKGTWGCIHELISEGIETRVFGVNSKK